MVWHVCSSTNLMQGLNCQYTWANSISLYCLMVYPCIFECVAGFSNHGPCWCACMQGNLLLWRFVLPCSDVRGNLIYRKWTNIWWVSWKTWKIKKKCSPLLCLDSTLTTLIWKHISSNSCLKIMKDWISQIVAEKM